MQTNDHLMDLMVRTISIEMAPNDRIEIEIEKLTTLVLCKNAFNRDPFLLRKIRISERINIYRMDFFENSHFPR